MHGVGVRLCKIMWSPARPARQERRARGRRGSSRRGGGGGGGGGAAAAGWWRGSGRVPRLAEHHWVARRAAEVVEEDSQVVDRKEGVGVAVTQHPGGGGVWVVRVGVGCVEGARVEACTVSLGRGGGEHSIAQHGGERAPASSQRKGVSPAHQAPAPHGAGEGARSDGGRAALCEGSVLPQQWEALRCRKQNTPGGGAPCGVRWAGRRR